jgi:ketosteroid isomerase-like protein
MSAGCATTSTTLREADEQAAIKKRLDEIWSTFDSKDIARLESYHWYGPKFTEFKDGARRGDAEANRTGEARVVAGIKDAKIVMNDLKIDVFGETAVVTFSGSFAGSFGDKPVSFENAVTFVFVKHDGDWKIVHEHFSPLAPAAPG